MINCTHLNTLEFPAGAVAFFRPAVLLAELGLLVLVDPGRLDLCRLLG